MDGWGLYEDILPKICDVTSPLIERREEVMKRSLLLSQVKFFPKLINGGS